VNTKVDTKNEGGTATGDLTDELYCAFYNDLLKLIHIYTERGAQLKAKHDPAHDIIRIIGPRATPRARAVDGLEDLQELAQATAEHHPYWSLLYHSAEVSDTVLSGWNGALSDGQIEDIEWSLREMDARIRSIKAIDR